METGSGMTRLISMQVADEVLKEDLENYKQQAIKLGASQAEVIPVHWVQVDERVRLKCLVGRCVNYGQCAYCPPYTPEPEFMRKALNRFHWAVLFKSDVIPVEDFTDVGRVVPHGVKHERKTFEITAKIERLAFADGHYLAMGFSCGSCRDVLCGSGLCQVLDSGRCRFSLKARPSMEAVGIDVYGLVTKVGWKIYPVYRGVNLELVPCAMSVGLVFIH